MRNEKLTLYYLAKYTNHELLIDEIVLTKGENQLESLSSNKAKNRSIKIKIIRTKIFYAIIFGILAEILMRIYYKTHKQRYYQKK